MRDSNDWGFRNLDENIFVTIGMTCYLWNGTNIDELTQGYVDAMISQYGEVWQLK